MALRNILREPRREITETLIGIAIVGPLVVADYFFARWLDDATVSTVMDREWHPFPLALGMPLGMFVIAAAVLALFGIHLLGEGLCNKLEQDTRLRLRPRR